MSEIFPTFFGASPIVIGSDAEFEVMPALAFAGIGYPAFGAPTSTEANFGQKPSVTDPMIISRRAYDSILDELQALRGRVANLETVSQGDDACDCREITNQKAKTEIAAYFLSHDGEDLYPSDISRALSLPYDQVSAMMDELVAEGKIGPAR